jgi:hypothetical protein
MRLKKATLFSVAAIATALAAAAMLYSSGALALPSSFGPEVTPIKAIVEDPAYYDGRNVTVIGALGSRETTTFMRTSLTITDSEGHYIDLLKPVPSWLHYDIEMPFMIAGTFTHYEYRPGGIQADPLEEGYGLSNISIEKVFNFVH